MAKISRSRRAQILRHAQQIRLHGQLACWGVRRIAATILSNLPDVHPLEAWRLAYGWSRPQVIEGIANLYRQDGLAPPAINSSMLCRWEHGEASPGIEYGQALCRLYQVRCDQLGFWTHVPSVVWLRPRENPDNRDPDASAPGVHPWDRIRNDVKNSSQGLAALLESIKFALEAEGPSGGPLTQNQLDQAIQYYALNYHAFPAGLLATEIYRCRAVVIGMLKHAQSPAGRTEQHRIGGWLSALLGNLTFHVGDYSAANIHLSTAAGLGVTIGDNRLISWGLGAQSMLARYQYRQLEALNMARQALEHADTPPRRSQVIAWAELPALAHLGRQGEARDAIITALREMDADPKGEQPGRFGFDNTELQLHLAEAELVLGNASAAAVHAQASLDQTTTGRPAWTAAVLALAHSEAQQGRPDQGAELALHVLDTIPAFMLRATSRQRLVRLDKYLTERGRSGTAAADLHDRLHLLPPPDCGMSQAL